MATFQKRIGPNGPRWRVRVRVKGHPIQTRTFDRKTDATFWASKIESDLRRGKHVPNRKELERTLTEAIDRYISEELPTKKRNKDKRHVITRLSWWKGQVGSYTLVSLTPEVILDHKKRFLAVVKNRNGNPIAPATINRYLATLSAVLKTAKNEWHWIERNPISNVSKGDESTGRTRFLSEVERNQLLEACKASKSKFLYPVVVLALSTGMRKGEILNLTWDCVDLKREKILIKDSKNSEQRTVGLSSHALDLVVELSKVRRIDSNFVFPGRGMKPADIEAAWQGAREQAELKDFRFHDLRHSAASQFLESGATLAQLAEILGHKTLQMVKRYSHLSDEHAAGLVERMNERVFGDG